MKKNGILNTELSKLFSELRHTDQIIIGDCGLPVPENVKQIDLSLKLGVPSFLDVLDETLEDVFVEKVFIAEEMKVENPRMYREMENRFDKIEYLSHEQLKEQSKKVKAIIRTGEATPYSNIILQSAVCF